MTKDMFRPSSKYAREGTAAHKVAEMVLGGDIFLPDKITVEDQEFVVSVGMCRALNDYIDYAQQLMAMPDTRHVIEQRVYVPDTFGMVWGTVDFGHVLDNVVNVIDLKFGRGVPVEPDSPQLKLYARGLVAHFAISDYATAIRLTVCQPRIEGPPSRSHITTLGDLQDWHFDVVHPAIKKIHYGDTSEKAGHWCRWCVRKTACKAFAARHQSHAAEVFDD